MVLEFEKPIADLEQKLQEMKDLAKGRNIDLSGDIASLEEKILALKKETFDNLTRWQRVQLSRHADRPMPWIISTKSPMILLKYMEIVL
jgi:acetyl-CoA carboxylase carboxyl transferase subunit alpha